MSEARPDATRPATNRLAGETSAYLRQHMHNPVDWHPWGEEALARARDEDKPLLVSIGYSACHWCHVMERESFEDPETAAQLNRDFLPVKVDREERPDLDQIYMECALRLLGHGGWPLTVFCTPDGRPFYAGTYFPPEPRHGLPSFRQVLGAVAQAYREQRDEVFDNASRIAAALAERPTAGAAEAAPGPEGLAEVARRLLRRADREHGGLGGGPKFPMPTSLNALLAAEDVLPGREARDARDFVVLTCREMARRGLYDQLGGGFHRYCVDAHWGVPHFEKMLYDQGQLLFTYAEAWRRTGGADDDLAWPVRETAAWLEAAMRGPEGGFFASQDADSEGVEGRYYVWTPEEVRSVLGPERGAAFCRAYAVTQEGNFEGRSVLWDLERGPRERYAAERAALLERRRERVPPETDPKRLAAWNGLAVSGLAYAGSVLGEPALVESAARAADFVRARLVDESGHLLRVFCDGEAKVRGFLDDHAALLAACLDLYRAGAGTRFLGFASELAETIRERFYDEAEGELFFTPDDGEPLVHRPRSDQDGAVPHPAGLAALGLLRLASLSGREELAAVARHVLRTQAPLLRRVPVALPTLLRAAAWDARGLSTAVVVGDPEAEETRALAARARRVLAPEEAVVVAAPGAPAPEGLDPAWLAGREPVEGRPAAYVCRGTACSLPVTRPDGLAPLDASSASTSA